MLDIAFALTLIVGLIALFIPQSIPTVDYSAESFDSTSREE